MREKLIEWCEDVILSCKASLCVDCEHNGIDYPKCMGVHFADHLIANGVTVQNQKGCEYCLEDTDGYRRGFGAFSLHNPFHANEWEISTGHCKPRKIYFCPMCGRKFARKG